MIRFLTLFPLTYSDSEHASNKEKMAGECQIDALLRGIGLKRSTFLFNKIPLTTLDIAVAKITGINSISREFKIIALGIYLVKICLFVVMMFETPKDS